ncbi:hypothetical protein Tco_1165660 [Tanacetum coccineum]
MRVTKVPDGVYRVLPSTTQEEQFADEKERKKLEIYCFEAYRVELYIEELQIGQDVGWNWHVHFRLREKLNVSIAHMGILLRSCKFICSKIDQLGRADYSLRNSIMPLMAFTVNNEALGYGIKSMLGPRIWEAISSVILRFRKPMPRYNDLPYTEISNQEVHRGFSVEYGKIGLNPQSPSLQWSMNSSIVFHYLSSLTVMGSLRCVTASSIITHCQSNDSDGGAKICLCHMIKDVDYYEKKMAREAALKSKRVFHADVRQATPAWTNANRVNKANQFTPRPVQLSSIRPNRSTVSRTVKTGRENVNTGHENVVCGPTPDSNVNVSRGPQGRHKAYEGLGHLEDYQRTVKVGSVTFGGVKVVSVVKHKSLIDEAKWWQQEEGKANKASEVSEALEDGVVDAMQGECCSSSSTSNGFSVDLPNGAKTEEGIDYDEFFALVARIEAIGTIDVRGLWFTPPGFVDPDHPYKAGYKGAPLTRLYSLEETIRISCWFKFMLMIFIFGLKQVCVMSLSFDAKADVQMSSIGNPKILILNAVSGSSCILKGKTNLGLWYHRKSILDLKHSLIVDYGGSNLTGNPQRKVQEEKKRLKEESSSSLVSEEMMVMKDYTAGEINALLRYLKLITVVKVNTGSIELNTVIEQDSTAGENKGQRDREISILAERFVKSFKQRPSKRLKEVNDDESKEDEINKESLEREERQMARKRTGESRSKTALGVNTPESDENRLKLYELMYKIVKVAATRVQD